ncbi:hypothetical protein RvY_01777 [Ramazzottius varieornatus]|uniref:SWIM-type domain-containing protein n=1 Tax=Ramazzottius varieornatus TaxID=947166 RepID=A0A1D1USP2_RAMVA|nr:hypothetical protein RvY_01777 [Ramazzottius varieornatus]
MKLTPFVEAMQKLVQKQEKDIEETLIDRTPGMDLLDQYNHLKVRATDFFRVQSEKDRKKLLRKIHTQPVLKKEVDVVIVQDSLEGEIFELTQKTLPEASSPRPSPVDSEESLLDGFANIQRGQRLQLEVKARALMDNKKYITDAPGDDDMCFIVASHSGRNQFHTVTINPKTGQVACDAKTCLPYRIGKICQHALAVAAVKKVSAAYAMWHNKQKSEAPLDKIASFQLAKGTGLKRHNRTQRRLGTTEKTSQISTLTSAEGKAFAYRAAADNTAKKRTKNSVAAVEPFTYELRFLSGCHGSVKKCFGCHTEFRLDGNAPSPPKDLVVVSQMIRSFKKNNQEQNGKVSPVYFHANAKCVEKHDKEFNPFDIVIRSEDKESFEPSHKKFLKQCTGKKV